jgi:CheY-like chemotaxis protein
MGPSSPPLILVLNGVEDITEIVRLYLEEAGWSAVTGQVDAARRSRIDLKAIVENHRPSAAIVDISPPYDVNYRYLNVLRMAGPLQGIPIIVTTTNEKRLREFTATDEPVIEVFGKPYDMQQVVEAVRKALEASPSR